MKKIVKSALVASTMIVAGAALSHDGATGGDGMHKGMLPMGQGMGMQRQPVDIAKLLNLDSARADKVNAILADERKERQALWESRKTAGHDDASKQAFRDKMMALRDSTKTKLTAVLTVDELQKLRDATAGHRMHRGHGPQSQSQPQGGEHKHG